MDDNLAWLTEKTEESKFNKPRFTFSPHTQYIQLNCKVIKKNGNPPPFLGLSPLSSKIFGTPPKWLNFLKVLLPSPSTPLLRRGGGGSKYEKAILFPKMGKMGIKRTKSRVFVKRFWKILSVCFAGTSKMKDDFLYFWENSVSGEILVRKL